MAPKKSTTKKTKETDSVSVLTSETNEETQTAFSVAPPQPTQEKQEENEFDMEPSKTTKKWESRKDDMEVSTKFAEKKEADLHSDDSNSESEKEKKEKVVYKKEQVKSRHQLTSVINFQYGDYRDQVSDKSTADLLKLLIVRAHDQNQSKLCETLKQTLRALHYECDFPSCSDSNPKKSQEHSYPQHQQYAYQSRPHKPEYRRSFQQPQQEAEQDYTSSSRFSNRRY
jgi:hypothetical protein